MNTQVAGARDTSREKNLLPLQEPTDQSGELLKNLEKTVQELQKSADSKTTNALTEAFAEIRSVAEGVKSKGRKLDEAERERMYDAFTKLNQLRDSLQKSHLVRSSTVTLAEVSDQSKQRYHPAAVVITVPEKQDVRINFSRTQSAPDGYEFGLSKDPNRNDETVPGEYHCAYERTSDGKRRYVLFCEKGCGPLEVKVAGKVEMQVDPRKLQTPARDKTASLPQIDVKADQLVGAIQKHQRAVTLMESFRDLKVPKPLETTLDKTALLQSGAGSPAFAAGRSLLLAAGASQEFVGGDAMGDFHFRVQAKSGGQTSTNVYSFNPVEKRWETTGKTAYSDAKSPIGLVSVSDPDAPYSATHHKEPRHQRLDQITTLLAAANSLTGDPKKDADNAILKSPELVSLEAGRVVKLNSEMKLTMGAFTKAQLEEASKGHQLLMQAGFDINQNSQCYEMTLPGEEVLTIRPSTQADGSVTWTSTTSKGSAHEFLKSLGYAEDDDKFVPYQHAANVLKALDEQMSRDLVEPQKLERAQAWMKRFSSRAEGFQFALDLERSVSASGASAKVSGHNPIYGPDKDFSIEIDGVKGLFWYNSTTGAWTSEVVGDTNGNVGSPAKYFQNNKPFVRAESRNIRGEHGRDGVVNYLRALDGQ